MVYDGEGLFKKCPFRLDKKGLMRDCVKDCALYVGKYPYGECALYVTAYNTVPKDTKDEN